MTRKMSSYHVHDRGPRSQYASGAFATVREEHYEDVSGYLVADDIVYIEQEPLSHSLTYATHNLFLSSWKRVLT